MPIDATYTDQQLLSLMMQDNKEAFDILYQRYWVSLYDAAYQRLKNNAQAEDIVQEIFLKFWLRRSELNIKNLSAYLHTSVRYKVYNYVARGEATEAFYQPYETITSPAIGADAGIIEKELTDLILAYINMLPKKRRQIFILYFEDNLSTKEIAARLKISQKTVQNQLGAAMRGLKVQLTPLIFLILLCWI